MLLEEMLRKERREGMEQGFKQGMEQGIEQGLEQGRNTGAVEMIRKNILSVIHSRKFEIPDIEQRLEEIGDKEQLEALFMHILSAEHAADIESFWKSIL